MPTLQEILDEMSDAIDQIEDKSMSPEPKTADAYDEQIAVLELKLNQLKAVLGIGAEEGEDETYDSGDDEGEYD
jgi:hypothetical protein